MNHNDYLTEQEIDEIVIAQANEDDAWEEPVYVTAAASTAVSLPPQLAVRAAFFAKLHNMTPGAWLQQVVEERLDFEEAAFASLKRVMENRPDYNAGGETALELGRVTGEDR
jgi:hypothetical protein